MMKINQAVAQRPRKQPHGILQLPMICRRLGKVPRPRARLARRPDLESASVRQGRPRRASGLGLRCAPKGGERKGGSKRASQTTSANQTRSRRVPGPLCPRQGSQVCCLAPNCGSPGPSSPAAPPLTDPPRTVKRFGPRRICSQTKPPPSRTARFPWRECPTL